MNLPRAKRWVNVSKSSPFPIPIRSLNGLDTGTALKEWPSFIGHIHGDGVVVRNPDHVKNLYHMGYFGKGFLSKSEPLFNKLATEDGSDWNLNEPLILSAPEAFFLAFGLGCLLTYITDKEQKPLNIEELWMYFSKRDVMFVYRYIVYHHFRAKGWVPRSGIKFGTDFILYKDGPPFYHASYSVVVRPVEDGTLRPLTKVHTWKSLAGLNRITEQVAKELMLCYVIQPNLPFDLRCPTCISKFKVQETVVKRWVSYKEREENVL